jgi:Type II secretion system protein C
VAWKKRGNELSETGLYVTSTRSSALTAVAWKIAAAVAWLFALGLLALTVAHWGWKWFGPAPVTIPVTIPDSDVARRVADAKLFGVAPPATPVGASASSGDLRLLGVFALRDGGGYALFRTARGPLIVTTGQEIAAGVRLDAVRPDGVTLIDGGVRREMVLRAATMDARPAVGVAQSAKPSACTVPPGFTGPIVRLNAELLGGMTGAPDAWKALLEAGSGALIVRDQSGFAGMLGLKNGDRVERANGIPLAIPGDIASTVLQPLTKSQAVWVAGTRDGKPQQWLYLNAGACPG